MTYLGRTGHKESQDKIKAKGSFPKSLHTLPKFAATTQKIQVGNGQCVSVLFIIPVIAEVHSHRFEIYMFVSEIHENVVCKIFSQ